MTLQAATVSFNSIQVGDQLPSLQKTETQETINTSGQLNRGEEPTGIGRPGNFHQDEELAKTGLFGGTVNGGPSTCAYMIELLQLVFSTKAIYGSAFSMRCLEPFRPGDTATFTGKVLDKREEKGKRWVDVEVKGTNQLGQTVAAMKATVPL